MFNLKKNKIKNNKYFSCGRCDKIFSMNNKPAQCPFCAAKIIEEVKNFS